MPRKRKNSESFYSNHVGNVEQTASGKFLVRARKRKIPTNEQEVTVETLESGKARLRKLDQLYLKKAAVPLADVPDPQLHAADRARADFYSRHKKALLNSSLVKSWPQDWRALRLKASQREITHDQRIYSLVPRIQEDSRSQAQGLRDSLRKRAYGREERANQRGYSREQLNGVPEQKEQERTEAIENVLNRSVGELFRWDLLRRIYLRRTGLNSVITI
jgi:hypothetical protein